MTQFLARRAALFLTLGLLGCSSTTPQEAGRDSWFVDVTGARGLPTDWPPWPDGRFDTAEIAAGSGVAVFDYDNDGRLDILQICHGRPGHIEEHIPNRLYRQEADGSFREIPGAAGLNDPKAGYCSGVAVGDYDNDGHCDVFVTSLGYAVLYHNNGDGSFTNVTTKAGLPADKRGWSSSASWVDYDRDGHLDLVVCNFAVYDPSRSCSSDSGREYCGPHRYDGLGATLYHNNGDGTFTDVTKKAGLDYPGRGWGVVCADFTDDGWVDLYVANDEERQNLWVNQHDGTFKDEALERGLAFGGGGQPEAGMGVAVGDIAGDGRLSLVVTHIRGEKNTMYVPQGKGTYADKSVQTGMTGAGLGYTGWGCGFCDFDNDGNLDLAVVNGRVYRGPIDVRARLGPFWNPYAENNVLLAGDGKGRFTYILGRGGDFTERVEITHGLAFGDFDGDGRVDLVTNTVDNRLRLYRNSAPSADHHWLSVRTMCGKRDALGARVEVRAGSRRWVRLAQSGYSFCSSSDPRVHVGLGAITHVDGIEVTWPDGSHERFEASALDCVVTLQQGRGQSVPR